MIREEDVSKTSIAQHHVLCVHSSLGYKRRLAKVTSITPSIVRNATSIQVLRSRQVKVFFQHYFSAIVKLM